MTGERARPCAPSHPLLQDALVAIRCRTVARRPASRSGAATEEDVPAAALRSTDRFAGHRPERGRAHRRPSPSGSSSTSPRSSATAIRTSPTAPHRRSGSSPRSVPMRSPSATRQVTQCYLRGRGHGSRASSPSSTSSSSPASSCSTGRCSSSLASARCRCVAPAHPAASCRPVVVAAARSARSSAI